MPLKKQNVAAVLHSQLSAILEKLLIVAVEEMKELVLDFFEEINREEAQNTDQCQRKGLDQEERSFDTPDVFYIQPQDASIGNSEQVTQTRRKDVKEKHNSEQNYVKFPVTNDFTISEQETLAPNFKVEESAASSIVNSQEEDSPQEDCKQSSFEPPEDTKRHLIDFNSIDDTPSSPYEDFSTNQGLSCDVECHIKQEEESPAFETGRNIDDINCKIEAGMNFDSFNARSEETHNAPLDNPIGPVLDIFPFTLPNQQMNEYASSQENQYPAHPELRLPPSKQVKNYTCDFCDKKFCYPSDLKHHRLWHTRERTHVCQICGKAFITRSHLRRHELMHLDVQPSVCQICGYKTSRMVYLKEHMKTHTKQKHV